MVFLALQPWGKNVSKDICRIKSGEIVKVKLGIVLPKTGPDKILEFNLCQNGKCVPGPDMAHGYGAEKWANPIPPLGKKKLLLARD